MRTEALSLEKSYMEKERKMKRFSIVKVSLITVLAVLLIYSPVHAVTNKVVLQIEGMT